MARVGVDDGVVVLRKCLEIEGGRAAGRGPLSHPHIGDEATAAIPPSIRCAIPDDKDREHKKTHG